MRKLHLLMLALTLTPALMMTCCTKKSGEPTAQSGSTKGKAPEEIVRQFIELSAGSKDDKDRVKLEELCSGEMRVAFERMTAEAFKIAYLNNNVKIKEIKILENTTVDGSARVRYQVAVNNTQGTDPTLEFNEREVELTLNDGIWQIASIRPKGSDKIAFTRGMIF